MPASSRYCGICGAVVAFRPSTSNSSSVDAVAAERDAQHQSLLEMLGEELRAEVESFLLISEREKPISEAYLQTIGRVTLDTRRSLLLDARITCEGLSINVIAAAFGPLIENTCIEGPTKVPIAEFGDEALSDLGGCIAVLRRGKVSFVNKALRAQEAGALAVIVMQTYDIWPFVMTDSAGEAGELTIPVLMVGRGDSEILSRILSQVRGVRMTLRLNQLTDECAICQDGFEEGQSVLKLPECGHAYHELCVLSWLEKQHTCPLCRKQMPKQTPGDKRAQADASGNLSYYI